MEVVAWRVGIGEGVGTCRRQKKRMLVRFPGLGASEIGGNYSSVPSPWEHLGEKYFCAY